MNLRTIFVVIITFLSIQFSSAQEINVQSSYDIVKVVSDANYRINEIYIDRRMPKGEIQNAVYTTNHVLMSIRDMITGGNYLSREKAVKLNRQVNHLKAVSENLNKDLSDKEFCEVMTEIKEKAQALNAVLRRIK